MGNQVQRTVNAYQGCEHRLPWSSKRSQLWGAFLNKFAVLVFVEMLPSFAKKATIVQCTGTLSSSSFCRLKFCRACFCRDVAQLCKAGRNCTVYRNVVVLFLM